MKVEENGFPFQKRVKQLPWNSILDQRSTTSSYSTRDRSHGSEQSAKDVETQAPIRSGSNFRIFPSFIQQKQIIRMVFDCDLWVDEARPGKSVYTKPYLLTKSHQ